MKPESFFERVHLTEDGCHEWTGAKHSTGYGAVWFPGRKLKKSHRYAWELKYGVIPEGLQVLHKCDNRLCVNPDHLFLGTNRDNVRDMLAKGRGHKSCGETHYYTKFSAEDVRRMREAYRFGAKQTDLARAYGTYQGTIGRIVRGEERTRVWQ